MIEDYPYVGMNFTGDLELVLPPGTQWGLDGKKGMINILRGLT